MIKSVIFDYDGVIVDSFMPVFKIHNKMFEIFNKGNFVTLNEFRNLNNTDWKSMYKSLGFTDSEIEKIPPVFLEEATKISHEFRLFNGIDSVIKDLHKRFRLAIVSNGDKNRIRHNLSKNDLLGCFDFIVGLEAEKHKPDPHQLHLCMDAIGSSPAETVFVGDTLEDITAGRNANVARVIAVSYGYGPRHTLASADIIADRPHDLLKILEDVK